VEKTTPLLCRLASLEPFVFSSRGEAMGCGFFFAPLGRPEKVGGSQVETHLFLLKILGRPQKSSGQDRQDLAFLTPQKIRPIVGASCDGLSQEKTVEGMRGLGLVHLEFQFKKT
jgi:hypothetical protein